MEYKIEKIIGITIRDKDTDEIYIEYKPVDIIPYEYWTEENEKEEMKRGFDC